MYIIYKIPKIKDDPEDDFKDGVAYAYILAPGSDHWTLSTKNVLQDSGSVLENTLDIFYNNEKDLTYILYNDDPPGKESKGTGGHAKGVLAFDDETGFWLIHSIPNFPDHEDYDYPESAQNYGQTALCVTFKTSELNEIIAQLLYENPNIYAKALTKEVEDKLDDNARSIFSKKPNLITKEPLERETELTSLGGVKFFSIAKDNQLAADLYSGMIAPRLKIPLLVETWRKGAGGNLEKVCNTDYTVEDVMSLNMKFGKGKGKKNVTFEYTKDHSKWATSKNYVCIADLNRMESQGKRGGGALCFDSPSVAKAFDDIIEVNDECGKEVKGKEGK